MKHVLSFILALVLLLSLCSCAHDSAQSTVSSDSSPAISKPTNGTTEATPTDTSISNPAEDSDITSTEASIPDPTTTPTESSKPAETSKPTESSEPEETIKPTESSEPEETIKPTESSKPEETSKPTESSEPEETIKPTESSEPEETSKPTESSEPTETSASTEPDESQNDSPYIYDENGIKYILSDGYLWVLSRGNCTQTNITIPDSVSDKTVIGIDSCAFMSDSTLESITISEGITTINGSAFSGCSSLKTVNLPSTIQRIEMNAFRNCAIASIQLPDGLTYIGKFAFLGLPMKHIIIPDSVQTIDQGAFRKSALEEITIPGNTVLEQSVFYGCTNLTTVTLQEGITAIPSQAFYKCSSLTNLVLPSTIVKIGSSAFYGCDNLVIKQLSLQNGPSTNAFSNLKIENLDVYTNLYQSAFVSANIQNLTIHEGVTCIGQDVFSRTHIGSITLPSSLSEVQGNAFYYSYIDEVVFTSPVSLGHSAFRGSSIKSITLPAGSTLGMYVFCDCSQLETIRYGGTMEQWRELIQMPNYSHNDADYTELNKATIICSDGTISPE